MAEEIPVYTMEELDGMTRTNLRRAAVSCGMSHRNATEMESGDIKDFIMSKQDGGEEEEAPKKAKGKGRGKGKAKDNGKAATAKVRGRGKAKAAPEPEPEAQDDGETEGVAGLIHKVGLGMDDGFKEIMSTVESLQAQNEELMAEVKETQHSLFLVSGLLTNLLRESWEPSEVEELVEDLDKKWQEQEEGDDEGND